VRELGVACNLIQHNHSPQEGTQTVRDYVGYCRQLCSIYNDKVFLLHQSVKAFLLSLPENSSFHMESSLIHSNITERCLKDISHHFYEQPAPIMHPLTGKAFHGHIVFHPNDWGQLLGLQQRKISGFWALEDSDLAGHLSTQGKCSLCFVSYSGVYIMWHVAQSDWEVLKKRQSNSDFFAETSTVQKLWLRSFGYFYKNYDLYSDISTFSPLHISAYWSLIPVMRDMLQSPIMSKVRLIQKDHQGNTPLHCAVQRNAIEAAETLIQSGANINAQNVWGWSALHYAVNANDFRLTKMLLNSGADIESGATAVLKKPFEILEQIETGQRGLLSSADTRSEDSKKLNHFWRPLHTVTGNKFSRMAHFTPKHYVNT
jgi:hypothetical protein